jgi:predicted DsbA family dithiol-disulfide isomerase
MPAETLTIDIWSDVACPWCHVGKRRLEAALADFPQRERVAVTWHAFELDTSAPRELDASTSYAARIARKYGCSEAEAEGMIANMTKTAAVDGLDFRFDIIRPGNTFDAHRLIHLAKERGKQDAVKERFLRGYLEEGARIGDHEALARLAVEAGLDDDEVREVLTGDAYAAAVRRDEEEASELGVRGVPFFVIGGKYAISGAQPASVFRQALVRTWDEIVTTRKAEVFAEGAVCGPDGCA